MSLERLGLDTWLGKAQPNSGMDAAEFSTNTKASSARHRLSELRVQDRNISQNTTKILITFLITFGKKYPKKTDFFKIEKEERKGVL